ncbi:hypothetical protein K7X08_006165 [Anisodus acutangulus]|uniref:Uncharacterized protein n=1 Tax=Anisodus acutangulus TaxID=402998 RepID=A0A9Q1MZ65_9SOLA|nr:hypothetical protein K7X08_006165 [Anisodus acutangulus]
MVDGYGLMDSFCWVLQSSESFFSWSHLSTGLSYVSFLIAILGLIFMLRNSKLVWCQLSRYMDGHLSASASTRIVVCIRGVWSGSCSSSQVFGNRASNLVSGIFSGDFLVGMSYIRFALYCSLLSVLAAIGSSYRAMNLFTERLCLSISVEMLMLFDDTTDEVSPMVMDTQSYGDSNRGFGIIGLREREFSIFCWVFLQSSEYFISWNGLVCRFVLSSQLSVSCILLAFFVLDASLMIQLMRSLIVEDIPDTKKFGSFDIVATKILDLLTTW